LPRWWRRSQLSVRRINLYPWLEVACAVALVVMLAASYLSLSSLADPSQLVPSGQAAAMLVGTLIPALGLIVLWGRRAAIRRAGGTTARLHVNLVFFFSLIAAIPTCSWRCLPRCCSSRAWSSGFPTSSAGSSRMPIGLAQLL
jgi:two-component system, NtrC family, nitrogen regulation sensor histidine kinase NtrY